MGKNEVIKNVTSSWFSLGVNILVGIFLSPFILHRLGNTAYGAWVLAFSITGYYGLFDLGIRSSIIRYVSTYSAKNDTEGLSRLINTSLAGFTLISGVAMLATIGLSAYVDRLFKIPPDFVTTARYLFLMVGAAVALGFPAGVFGGILEGLNRFYFVNATNLATTLIRAPLIILAMTHGYGLLMVAFITVSLPLLGAIVRAAIVLHVLPLKFGWKYIDRGSFREIAHYSTVSFIITLAYKLRFKTDEVVISTLLSVTAVTFFSNGDRLVDYTTEVVSSLAQIFVPMSGQSSAKGDITQLRKIFVAGNRACALVVLPITATLIILGKSVITAWVGPRYVTACYPVMLTLLIPSTFSLCQAASGRILYGMARHKSLAWVTSMEGIANLILSIILIRPYGIIGDALGTAIPLTCTTLFFLPRHLCRVLNVRIRTFVREAYTLPVLLCIPTVLALLLMRRWFFARNYLEVALQMLIGLTPYALGLAWAIWTKRVWKVPTSLEREKLDAVGVALIQSYPEKP
ncbi:MAG: oligosaccharide flippase family protein [Acidobacteriales bacterium]|nr:oligosaccharide flippase family protein [Terriglobales bacterium]